MKRTSPKWIAMVVLLILFALAGSVLADNLSIRQSLLAPVINTAADCTTVVTSGQSIQAVISTAQRGNVICVRAGTYPEQLEFGINKAGVTVMAYPGERPILDGRNTIPTGKFQGLIQINASDVIVDGFEVRNSAARGVVIGHPTNGTTSLRNTIVRNLVVHGSYDAGINVNGLDEYHLINILIENNVIYNNLLKNATGNHNGGSALAFIDVDNSTARGNVIYNNHGEGLVAGRWTSNLTFEDNVLYDNKHASIYLSTTANPVVQRNFVFCTGDQNFWRGKNGKLKPPPGITLRDEDFEALSVKPPPSFGQVIINNIVVGCGINLTLSTQITGGGLTNAVIANNTFVNARGDSGSGANNILIEGDVTLRNSSFVNNLILQSDPSAASAHLLRAVGDPDMSTFTLANNLYSVPPTKHWPATENGRIINDPKLVNPIMPVKGSVPDVNGYALQSNSPAINAGRAVAQVTVDFFGQNRSGALDIGADEAGGGGGGGPTTGQIFVIVATTPDQSAQVFSFTPSYPGGSFQLTDGATHSSGELTPGTHSVSMTAVAGWTSSATCSDGSSPGSINLAAGETVTCTFNNEQQTEPVTRLIIRKETIPAGETQVFQFTSNFAGTFGLAHGGSKTTDVAAGIYSVSESVPAGWTQASATCNDGSSPDAVNVSVNETVICTFINQTDAAGGGGSLDAVVYLTTDMSGTVGGVNFEKGDILAYDGRNEVWSLHFDASDVGITNSLNDFVLMPDGSILLAISGRTTLAGPSGSFKLQLWDVARFVPSGLGNDTAGSFEMYIDGSDVGLTKASEKIDALARQPNGTILISTYGAANVPNGSSVIKAQDEDLLAFQPSSTGDNTQGVWSLAFDGSTITGMGAEDVNAAWRDGNSGTHYLALSSNFNVGGVTGTPSSVLTIVPGGAVTQFWNASDAGFTGPITGLHIVP